MGILVDWRKIREDGLEVEYCYGFPPELDRRLLVHKETGQARPVGGPPDPIFPSVASKILRLHRAQRTWPDQGTYAA